MTNELNVGNEALITTEKTSTTDLLGGEPKNPWREKLKTTGVPLAINPRYLNTDLFPEGTDIDPLTGLPIEQENFRKMIASEFTDCIRKNKNFLLIFGDVDNLKTANTNYGREMGDMVIMSGASMITEALDKFDMPESSKIFVSRQTGAADETAIWIFGLDDETQNRIKEKYMDELKPVKTDDPDFLFSVSTSICASNDGDVKTLQNSAREYLTTDENQTKIAYKEFNMLKDLADEKVKKIKIEKDIERIDFDRLEAANGYAEVIQVLTTELANSRLSKILLESAFEIVAFEAKNEPDPDRINKRKVFYKDLRQRLKDELST